MESESRDFRMESELEWNQEIFLGILLESESELESGFLMKSGIGVGIGIKHFWNRALLSLTISAFFFCENMRRFRPVPQP